MNIPDSNHTADLKKPQPGIKGAITSIRRRSVTTIHSVNEEILSRLNSLAGKQPFCTWFKYRKHDPL